MTSLRIYTLVASLALPLVAWGLDGCKIVDCKDGAVCTDSDPDTSGSGPKSDAHDLCTAFCGRLETCTLIANASVPSCVDTCHDAMQKHPDATTAGCHCAIDAACSDAEECDGAPFPSGSSGSSGGTGAASGAGGAGGGPGSCGGGDVCTAPDVCVEGTCRTPCEKSCQCPEGDSCQDGYCGTPEPTPPPCADDCDCPSGQACTAGVCG